MGVSIGRRSRALWVVGLAVALGATSSLAEAQRRGRAPRGPSIAEAQPLLDSTNPDEIRLGLETAVTVGGAPAAEAIAQRIRRGLPAEVLDSAIDSLAALGRREAGPVLFELLNHRRATIRAHAAEAVVAALYLAAKAERQDAILRPYLERAAAGEAAGEPASSPVGGAEEG